MPEVGSSQGAAVDLFGCAVFAKHAASSLRSWSDHDLEEKGRLTQPLYDLGNHQPAPATRMFPSTGVRPFPRSAVN
jgi:hypothetical protein